MRHCSVTCKLSTGGTENGENIAFSILKPLWWYVIKHYFTMKGYTQNSTEVEGNAETSKFIRREQKLQDNNHSQKGSKWNRGTLANCLDLKGRALRVHWLVILLVTVERRVWKQVFLPATFCFSASIRKPRTEGPRNESASLMEIAKVCLQRRTSQADCWLCFRNYLNNGYNLDITKARLNGAKEMWACLGYFQQCLSMKTEFVYFRVFLLLFLRSVFCIEFQVSALECHFYVSDI